MLGLFKKASKFEPEELYIIFDCCCQSLISDIKKTNLINTFFYVFSPFLNKCIKLLILKYNICAQIVVKLHSGRGYR